MFGPCVAVCGWRLLLIERFDEPAEGGLCRRGCFALVERDLDWLFGRLRPVWGVPIWLLDAECVPPPRIMVVAKFNLAPVASLSVPHEHHSRTKRRYQSLSRSHANAHLSACAVETRIRGQRLFKGVVVVFFFGIEHDNHSFYFCHLVKNY